MAICASVITRKEDKVLLVRIAPPFAEHGKWNFPGGVIEDGKDIRVGLDREVFEETGVTCSIGKIRDNFTTESPDNNITIFDAVYTQREFVIQEEEILEARWLTIPEALTLDLAFNIRKYIDK